MMFRLSFLFLMLAVGAAITALSGTGSLSVETGATLMQVLLVMAFISFLIGVLPERDSPLFR